MRQPLVKSKNRYLQRLHPWQIRGHALDQCAGNVRHDRQRLENLSGRGVVWLLHFPDSITIGGSPEGALQWHFLGMWVLAINGLIYLIYGLAMGRFRRKLLPIHIDELIANIREAEEEWRKDKKPRQADGAKVTLQRRPSVLKAKGSPISL